MLFQNPQTQNASTSKPQMSKKHKSSSSSKPNSTFFQIPIFPPILASYDVPAPVIIPPVSDPCLQNPNPYDDQVLKTPSSMDFDPCVVALRTETVVNRVDLTASEHAGVSFGEPAIFTYPHKVNIHSKSTEKIAINQESNEKKQDSDNIIQIVSTVIAPEIPSSVGNLTSLQESEKIKIELLQKEEYQYPESLFVCDIPEPGCYGPKIATVEVDECLFKNLTTQLPVQPSDIVTQKPYWCDICKVGCTSNKDYNRHIDGKQHHKKLKLSEKIPENLPLTVFDSPPVEKLTLTRGEVVNPNEGNSLTCELCGVNCTSLEVYKSHVVGKRHQKNLKKSEQESVSSIALVPDTPLPKPMIEEGKNVFLEGSKRKVVESCSSEDTKRQKTDGVLVTCKVCNVSCNGVVGLKTHIASLEHLAMLHK